MGSQKIGRKEGDVQDERGDRLRYWQCWQTTCRAREKGSSDKRSPFLLLAGRRVDRMLCVQGTRGLGRRKQTWGQSSGRTSPKEFFSLCDLLIPVVL